MSDATVWFDRQERRRLLLALGCIAMAPTSVVAQAKRAARIGPLSSQTILMRADRVIE